MPAASIQSISSARTKKTRPPDLIDEALEALCVRLQVLDQLEQAALELAVGRALELLAGPGERFVEALAVERLEQVVEGVDVERAQRVVIEGGDEDDERHPRRADGFDDVEAGGAGHLDVEEHQVGFAACRWHRSLRCRSGTRRRLRPSPRGPAACAAARAPAARRRRRGRALCRSSCHLKGGFSPAAAGQTLERNLHAARQGPLRSSENSRRCASRRGTRGGRECSTARRRCADARARSRSARRRCR